MVEKRETDLINLKIMRMTEEVFPEETTILRATTNFMRRLTAISGKALPQFNEQPSLRAVLELFCRNRELTHFSIVCMVDAGYSETKILSRVAIENFLLMRLFAIRPEIANMWFSSPEAFRKQWKPEDVREAVFSKLPERARNYATFYWGLCDYAHPSFKGWYEIFKQMKEGVFIGARPEFNADYASECIGLICFVAIQTIKAYVSLFQRWLNDDMIKETKKLMPKVSELVSRHFEVRTYYKERLFRKKG